MEFDMVNVFTVYNALCFLLIDIYHEVVKKSQELETLLQQNTIQPSVPIADSLRLDICQN